MKNISKKSLKFICAAFAAFLTVSCASTPKAENASTDSYQNAESETPQNENTAAEEKTEKTENQPDSPLQKESENEPAKNPLETIVEQNFSGEINITEEENQNSNEKTDEISPASKIEAQKENHQDSDEQTEKIDSEDLLSSSENQTVPTADEPNKISEPDVSEVFVEPEVIDAEAENELNQEKQEQISEPEPEPEPVSEKEETQKTQIPEQTQSDSTQSEEDTQTEPEISENNEPENSEQSEPEEQDSESEKETLEIAPSRSVTIKRNQYLDVVYPGNGWIYLGENGTQLLRYFGRRIGQGSSTFSFRSSKEGNAILHFYKNDALTGNFIDDYLEVVVENEVFRGSARAKAPDYAEIVPPRFEKRKETAQKATETESNQENLPEKDSNESEYLRNLKNQEISQKSDEKVSPAQEQTISKDVTSNSSAAAFSDNVKTVISNSDSKADNSKNQSTQFYTQNPAETQSEEQNQNLAENVEAEPEVQFEADEQENLAQADESLLEKAKQLFEEKKYEESLENVQKFINGSSKRLDEAYYLLGQLYESNSSIKNIRNAVDAYDTVTKDYPLSKLWRNANQRSVYLKRFYIDIR